MATEIRWQLFTSVLNNFWVVMDIWQQNSVTWCRLFAWMAFNLFMILIQNVEHFRSSWKIVFFFLFCHKKYLYEPWHSQKRPLFLVTSAGYRVLHEVQQVRCGYFILNPVVFFFRWIEHLENLSFGYFMICSKINVLPFSRYLMGGGNMLLFLLNTFIYSLSKYLVLLLNFSHFCI